MRAILISDLPQAFIERFSPVIGDPRERGLKRYLFDTFGLNFFRSMSTAGPVPIQAIWSVMPSSQLRDSLELIAGERSDAVGYVVTNVFRDSDSQTLWTLPRRLTLRQKVRRMTLRSLIDDLRQAPLEVPDEVVRFIENRLEGTA